ncbi:hypothetical protein FA13DRAFT_1737742, partial [Coprinellus micaceus]
NHLVLRDLATPPSLLNLLCSTGDTLTRLILHLTPLSLLASLPPGQFHALQSLVYCRPSGRNWRHTSGEPVVAFQDAPSLRRVALDATFPFTSGRNAPSFVLPWNQLTHFLDFDAVSESTLLFTPHFLSQTWGDDMNGNDFSHGVWERPPGPDFMVMNSVTTLALGFPSSMAYTGMFDKVDFPSVRALRLRAEEACWQRYGESQSRFLTKLQTFKKVEFLSLWVPRIDNGELESLFETAPRAHTLHLFTHGLYTRVFQILEAKPELLPHLHTLVLDYNESGVRDSIEFTYLANSFRRLLEARTSNAHPTSCIRRIVVWSRDRALEREFEGVIRRFVESDGIVFGWRLSERRENMSEAMWMEMDPTSNGWEEARVTLDLIEA